jgi:hypothetical protein
MPYQNERLLISKDYVQKKRSRESMNQIRSMRESFISKWNKMLLTNVSENECFKANNVGTSFLTSPVNYSQQVNVKTLMSENREKINKDLQRYSSKMVQNSLISLPSKP